MVIIIHIDTIDSSFKLINSPSVLLGKLYIICSSLKTNNINKSFYYVELGIPSNNVNNLTTSSILPIHIGHNTHGYNYSEFITDISRRITCRILEADTLLQTTDSVQISLTCDLHN